MLCCFKIWSTRLPLWVHLWILVSICFAWVTVNTVWEVRGPVTTPLLHSGHNPTITLQLQPHYYTQGLICSLFKPSRGGTIGFPDSLLNIGQGPKWVINIPPIWQGTAAFHGRWSERMDSTMKRSWPSWQGLFLHFLWDLGYDKLW